MREIDFLPPWYVAGRRARKDRVVRIGYLVLVVVGIAVLAFIRHARTAVAESSMAALRGTIPTQTSPGGEAAHRRARWEEQNRRRRLLADVDGGAPAHALLAELSAVMPEATLVSELHFTEGRRFSGEPHLPANQGKADAGEMEGSFQVRGLAASDAHVGGLMAGLGRSAPFAEVTLGYSRPVQMEGRQAREFELTGRLPAFE